MESCESENFSHDQENAKDSEEYSHEQMSCVDEDYAPANEPQSSRDEESSESTELSFNALERKLTMRPPDFKMSWTHLKANKVKVIDTEKEQDLYDLKNYCPCCVVPKEKITKDIPLCVDSRELDVLGSGFPLYYHSKKFSIIIFVLMTLIVGIPCMIINIQQGNVEDCWDWPARILFRTTIAKYIDEYGFYWCEDQSSSYYGYICPREISYFEVHLALNFCFILILFIASIFLRVYQSKIISEIDEENITPSDFGLMVSNVPEDKRPDELKNWFKEKFPDVDIAYVNYCYNIEKLVKITRKIEALEAKKTTLEAYKDKILEDKGLTEQDAAEQGVRVTPIKYFCCIKRASIDIEALENKILKAQEEQKEVIESMGKLKDSKYFSGKTFVVLNKQTEATKILEYFETTLISRAYSEVLFACKKINQNIRKINWDENLIYVKRAPEPEDIYWENLNVSTKIRFCKIFITTVVTVICLFISFCINIAIKSYSKSLFDKNSDTCSYSQSSSREDNRMLKISSFTISSLVIFVNLLLCKIVRTLSYYERHETHTKYHLSVAIKLTIAMFANTVLIPYISNVGGFYGDTFRTLVIDVFFISLSVSFITPLVYLFDPAYLFKLFKRWREERKGEKSMLTQKQANKLFEGPPFDMAQRYANTMLLICLAVFYISRIPIVSIILLFGAVFQYWLEKYLLLRRHKRPEKFSHEMSQVFSNMVPFLCLLYGMSLFDTSWSVYKTIKPISYMYLIVPLLLLILPICNVFKKCQKDIHKNDVCTHKEERMDFLTDYDRCNPATAKSARITHQRRLEAATINPNIGLKINEDEDSFEGIRRYGREPKFLEGRPNNLLEKMQTMINLRGMKTFRGKKPKSSRNPIPHSDPQDISSDEESKTPSNPSKPPLNSPSPDTPPTQRPLKSLKTTLPPPPNSCTPSDSYSCTS
ncbi:unnamed protein product [Moneuplotes crassus]|uniref:CSC1/OSCA1-like cytosolic domain-containing protein n=1 Tax=Euplotes crassus TaxID=5936 RepID=A0AAD1UI01_EUPCR|nr:unnamed protein product [Moneuplotes crassus]